MGFTKPVVTRVPTADRKEIERQLDGLLTDADRERLEARGITREALVSQLETFHRGCPPVNVDRACTVGDGIMSFGSDDDRGPLLKHFDQAVAAGRVMKFVPSSGAASRMFRSLLEPWSQGAAIDEDALARSRAAEGDARDLARFFDELPYFAFTPALDECMSAAGHELGATIAGGDYRVVLEYVLADVGLSFRSKPKGLIPFHRHGADMWTPFEEHLSEAARYCRDAGGSARIHFTVATEHMMAIDAHLRQATRRIAAPEHAFEVTMSTQKPSTDTIAVDLDNAPLRAADGRLLLRPAGHGALIENLNELQGDIVFIKNIDNVVPEHLADDTYMYKRVLGGLLVELQERSFDLLRRLSDSGVSQSLSDEVRAFASGVFGVTFQPDFDRLRSDEQTQLLHDALNCPLRVCGVVRNTGDPGGGPFWVRGRDDSVTPQIVEQAQIQLDVSEQADVFRNSTHFNPVDLVCGLRDFRGEAFELAQFVDLATSFIATKWQDGVALKALERPGLWNGGMAFWNTVFVEVPRTTFNPVKTVFDLLRPEHRADSAFPIV